MKKLQTTDRDMVFKLIYLNKKPLKSLALATLLGLGVLQSANAIEAGQFYRYVNEDGVRVISASIPPAYAQKGYEVINRAGQVLRTVEAAPDPEEVEAAKAKRAEQLALLSQFKVLARRYSNVKEIYAARDRRLAQLNANISILKSNINNLSGQIDQLMSKAAGYERAGQKVPFAVLKNLEETRAEKKSTEGLLKDREEEHQEIWNTFEKSAELYKQGKQLDLKVKDGEIELADPNTP